MPENKTCFLISVKNIISGRGEDFETVPMTEVHIELLIDDFENDSLDYVSFRSREKGIVGSGDSKYFYKHIILQKKNFDIFTIEVAPIPKVRKGPKHNAKTL